MNNNLNSYGYQEATKLYTWREETHDWRKYIEKHLDNHIENAKTTIVTRIDTAEGNIRTDISNSTKTITAKIDGVQNYLTETIYPAVDTLESSIGDIWGKIEKWPNTIN